MEKIATDIYTFAELRGSGYTYVDKTDRILPLVNDSQGKMFFLARPRRFGKSLLISTLKALFQGKRELFNGLAIEPQWDWTKTYPVIHLDMGSTQSDTVDRFERVLIERLARCEDELGLSHSDLTIPQLRFQNICERAAKMSPTGQVVILIDEYDKPLLGHLCRPEVDGFRSALKSFYSVVKTCESLQRFAFITGVSKFSKVSIFSDLNNLVDITLSAQSATLLGYTHEEVRRYFPERLAALADANGQSDADAAFDMVIRWYDGYRFEENAEKVVNPVSLGRCLSDMKFRSYWYETGTPSFLIDLLRRRPMDISNLMVSDSQLGAYEPRNPAIEPLLFQTGYLTIRSFEMIDVRRYYHLCFPNEEVRTAFNESLMSVYTDVSESDFALIQFACRDALIAHDLTAFFDSLSTVFAQIPYDLTDRQNEQTWQAILVVILNFVGFRVIPEDRTNRGRIDVTLLVGDEVYVLELKLDRPADEAIAQIEAKRYAEKYCVPGKRVTLIGVSFSTKDRALAEWKAKEADWEGR